MRERGPYQILKIKISTSHSSSKFKEIQKKEIEDLGVEITRLSRGNGTALLIMNVNTMHSTHHDNHCSQVCVVCLHIQVQEDVLQQ